MLQYSNLLDYHNSVLIKLLFWFYFAIFKLQVIELKEFRTDLSKYLLV